MVNHEYTMINMIRIRWYIMINILIIDINIIYKPFPVMAGHLSIARRPVQAAAVLMLGAALAGIHAQGDQEA